MSRSSSRGSLHLEPPRKSVELIDPGAHELGKSQGFEAAYPLTPCTASSDDNEYFSDASEGRQKVSRPATPASPIPRTRVERVDDSLSHGEVPGTPAYEQRVADAVPDEVEVLPEGRLSKRSSQYLEPPRSPGGTTIPRTVVEKVDPASPSHGDVPGTEAYEQRKADATPDIILKAPEPGRRSPLEEDSGGSQSSPSEVPVPKTIITRVDSNPAHGEVEGTPAFDMRKRDATPDKIERKDDAPGKHS